MTAYAVSEDKVPGHPLDSLANFFVSQDWVFDRPQPDQLQVAVAGRQGAYRLSFLWQEEFSALQFSCACDIAVGAADEAPRALRAINEKLWLGHFDLTGGEAVPTFRHTALLRGPQGGELVEDLIEIGLAECERHYNVFTMLADESLLTGANLDLALADEAGIA